MNTPKVTIVLTAILALTLLANVNIGNVYATGNMDDEEEEEAIEELQSNVSGLQEDVSEIKENVNDLSVNLVEGINNLDLTAICPTLPNEEEEEPTQNNETTVTPEIPTCAPIPEPEEPEQNQTTVLPPVEAEPEEPAVECEPIPEEQNETQSVLEPILCPTTGDLLGYTNTTSGELLPISAGENETSFLPPIEIPEEEPPAVEEQNVTETIPPAEVEQQQECNNVTSQPTTTIAPTTIEAPTSLEDLKFDVECSCYVVDTTGVPELENATPQ